MWARVCGGVPESFLFLFLLLLEREEEIRKRKTFGIPSTFSTVRKRKNLTSAGLMSPKVELVSVINIEDWAHMELRL